MSVDFTLHYIVCKMIELYVYNSINNKHYQSMWNNNNQQILKFFGIGRAKYTSGDYRITPPPPEYFPHNFRQNIFGA